MADERRRRRFPFPRPRLACRVRRATKAKWTVSPKIQDVPCTDKELLRVVHETIKKVGEDIEKLSFNTAISQMMICTNAFTQAEVVPLKEFTQLLAVLNPFAPHFAEEINSRLGGTAMLSETTWPTYDEAALVRNEIELVVQVNGKLRDRFMVSKDIDEEGAKTAAFASSQGERTPRRQNHPQDHLHPRQDLQHRRELTNGPFADERDSKPN